MVYVVAATYRTKPGEEESIRAILETMTDVTRAEPACRFYQAHRSVEDPRVFFLYEQYDDESGYEAHMGTEHFKKHILEDAISRLESRERAFYSLLP